MTSAEFAQRLIRARAIAGLTQSELAARSGISAAQISRYETGVNEPRPYAKYRLAGALGIKGDWSIDPDVSKDVPIELVNWAAISTGALVAELARRCS
ncbi:helix-turn-helix domain-containing protein [Comamonas sp. MYb69]|uniref:helix-turn-helix domain-containing protein n=1 Tax=Comamonas sp. MYb69 TaxID=1848650 RepID=UPI0030B7982E